MASITLEKGVKIALPTLTKSNYTFNGWYDAQTGGTKYSGTITPDKDIILYSHFTKIETDSKVTTKKSSLKATGATTASFKINGPNGTTRTFTVFKQASFGKYFKQNGCSICSLTCILTGLHPDYKNTKDPRDKIWKMSDGGTISKDKLVYKVLGKSSKHSGFWPPSIYGHKLILKSLGIDSTLITYFTKSEKSKVIDQLYNHLYSGKQAIITLNKKNQRTGKETKKWAASVHTMAILGVTESGDLIIADSATRSWSGSYQRIKFMSKSDLSDYLKSSSEKTAKNKWFSSPDSYGILLINK